MRIRSALVPHIDVSALDGDERALVESALAHHTAASREVLETLTGLDIPVPRARLIMLQALLVLAGCDAVQQRIDVNAFAGLALTGHVTAGEMLAIGHNIQGEA